MIKRFHMELVTAGGTATAALLAIYGAQELGVGWSSHGPDAGYFPFYVGIILLLASLGNVVSTLVSHRRADVEPEEFLNAEQLKRLATFFLPMLAFVVVTVFAGLYVGAILYLSYVAWRQGKYNPFASLALGVGFAVALYIIFEILFKVPLHKGPLEHMLGIY